MDIKPNSSESYRGKDIREWCEECTDNDIAKEINKEYFSKRGNRPSETVYYFIETFPKLCLVRDYERSPRKYCRKRY